MDEVPQREESTLLVLRRVDVECEDQALRLLDGDVGRIYGPGSVTTMSPLGTVKRLLTAPAGLPSPGRQ